LFFEKDEIKVIKGTVTGGRGKKTLAFYMELC
jgi:hypothetical protein